MGHRHARHGRSVDRAAASILAVMLLLAACAPAEDTEQAAEADAADTDAAGEASEAGGELERLGTATALEYADFADEGIERWEDELPAAEDVRIASSLDGYEQPAMWLGPPDDGSSTPLLVVLHSWHTRYQQHQSIPLLLLAGQLGWAAIAPDFRGVFDRPEAAGSDESVQDVIDAVDWAVEQADIDEERVYVTGFSGGGMMTLLVAGRHPERFAGAAAWVPVHDLTDFYAYNVEHRPDGPYPDHIRAICGGDPTDDSAARQECDRRSPTSYLDVLADHDLPLLLAHGLADDIVRPDGTLEVYNAAVDPEEPIDSRVIDAVADNRLPGDLAEPVATPLYFEDNDPELRFSRADGPSGVVLFEGEHDLVYHPTMRWFADLAARSN